MPAYVLLCRDKPDGFELRAATRPAHLDFMAEAGGVVLLAGPVLDGEGRSIGSMLVIDVEDTDGARAFAANDPYAKAGLFVETTILPFRPVTGTLLKTE